MLQMMLTNVIIIIIKTMQENFTQLKWNFINFILLEFLHKREELFQWGKERMP